VTLKNYIKELEDYSNISLLLENYLDIFFVQSRETSLRGCTIYEAINWNKDTNRLRCNSVVVAQLFHYECTTPTILSIFQSSRLKNVDIIRSAVISLPFSEYDFLLSPFE